MAILNREKPKASRRLKQKLMKQRTQKKEQKNPKP